MNTLPVENVLILHMEDGCFFAVRPSGTEPKLNSIMNAVEQIEKKFILYQKSSMLKLQKLSDRIWKFQILF